MLWMGFVKTNPIANYLKIALYNSHLSRTIMSRKRLLLSNFHFADNMSINMSIQVKNNFTYVIQHKDNNFLFKLSSTL